MNEVEKKELDTEVKDICKDICNNVLQRVIDENGITDLGTCGIDMSEPENIVMVAMAIEASSDRSPVTVIHGEDTDLASQVLNTPEAKKVISDYMEVGVPDQASDLNEEVDSKRIREALLRHCKTSRDQLTEAGINLEGL